MPTTTPTPPAANSPVFNDINTALGIATDVATVAAATGNPIAVGIAGALNAAGSVAQTVETTSAHQTAIADIGNAVTALANTPLVQSNPAAAQYTSLAASFFSWLKSEFSKL
jgi:hypothetical protein